MAAVCQLCTQSFDGSDKLHDHLDRARTRLIRDIRNIADTYSHDSPFSSLCDILLRFVLHTDFEDETRAAPVQDPTATAYLSCPKCTFATTTSYQSLQRHYLTHIPYQKNCPLCDKPCKHLGQAFNHRCGGKPQSAAQREWCERLVDKAYLDLKRLRSSAEDQEQMVNDKQMADVAANEPAEPPPSPSVTTTVATSSDEPHFLPKNHTISSTGRSAISSTRQDNKAMVTSDRPDFRHEIRAEAEDQMGLPKRRTRKRQRRTTGFAEPNQNVSPNPQAPHADEPLPNTLLAGQPQASQGRSRLNEPIEYSPLPSGIVHPFANEPQAQGSDLTGHTPLETNHMPGLFYEPWSLLLESTEGMVPMLQDHLGDDIYGLNMAP